MLMCLVVQVVNLGSILMLKFERERKRVVWISTPVWSEWILFGLMLGHGERITHHSEIKFLSRIP